MISIRYRDGMYYCLCDFTEKEIPKRAGFTWDKVNRLWVTPWAITAAKIAPDDPAVIEGLSRLSEVAQKSGAAYSEFSVPAPDGLSYRPYQLAGIEFMRNRRSVLLGDEMGIGKTIQAIGLYNYHCLNGLKNKQPRVLIVCPASLKRNWLLEWRKWATRKQSIGMAEGKDWPGAEIVVINYDILPRYKENVQAVTWDILILDECQYLKNSKTRRTQNVCGSKEVKPIQAKCKLALTGTPIPNRPVELYSILRYLDPLGWPNKLTFAKRYCAAVPNGFGWDMNGASNLYELQEKLRSSVMLRRLKSDVMTELPAKQRQIIEVEIPEGDEIIAREKRLLKGLGEKEILSDDEYRDLVKVMRGGDHGDFEKMSTIRRLNAVAKIPIVIEHLREAIEASGKVVVFCHHTEVVQALEEAFKSSLRVSVTGKTPLEKRHENVQRFQNDPETKLFIGNIIAAGTGLTLTASSHVVFAELDWVPGNVSQAEDRCHRHGQENQVLIQHIVAAGSIDAVMAKTIVYKQGVIEKALNFEASSALEKMLQ